MTDNEVIKALKCCSHCECSNDKNETECPLYYMSFCRNYLRKQSLDLINRQKAEIKNLKAEIAEHKAMLEAFDNELVSFNKAIKTAKSEAIKEFAERLKEKYKCHILCSFNVINNEIDNLVKEMTEVQK